MDGDFWEAQTGKASVSDLHYSLLQMHVGWKDNGEISLILLTTFLPHDLSWHISGRTQISGNTPGFAPICSGTDSSKLLNLFEMCRHALPCHNSTAVFRAIYSSRLRAHVLRNAVKIILRDVRPTICHDTMLQVHLEHNHRTFKR